MRFFLILIGGLLAAACIPAHAQVGYDRRGSDYFKFEIRTGDPALCAARCDRDARCRSWSFSYPRTANTLATCWLKNQVPSPVADKCCMSGVRGSGVVEPRRGPTEYSIDRYGGDYRNFDVAPDPEGATCKAVCNSENRCRAWTYVRPGYYGASAHCYVKDKIKPPRRNKPCCISGVVR